MVGPVTDEAAAAARRTNETVRDLLGSAKRTRAGGWSIENLLDSLFLLESAALAQRGQIIDQNLTIISLLEDLQQTKQ